MSKKIVWPKEWNKIEGEQNLYFRRSRNTYATRIKVNGSDGWKYHGTDVPTIAKLRHREALTQAEKDRQAGVKPTANEFQTLGTLAAEYERRIEGSTLAEKSRLAYKTALARLRAHWDNGTFETCAVRLVDRETILALRKTLQTATVAHGRKDCVREQFHKTGYSNVVINATLDVLRRLIDIAVEKRSRVENPFAVAAAGVLQERLSLPKNVKVPELPSRELLESLLVELRAARKALAAYPAGAGTENWRKRHLGLASEAADFAEFLVFTGSRHQEANLVKVKFYTPAAKVGKKFGRLFIPGYKTKSSKRTIPVIPPLARLLDRLVVGRDPEEKLLAANSCLKPLQNACAALNVKRMTQHDLRHWFATFMLEKTRSHKAVSHMLGHGDGGTLVLKTYGHLFPDFLDEALGGGFDNEVEQALSVAGEKDGATAGI